MAKLADLTFNCAEKKAFADLQIRVKSLKEQMEIEIDSLQEHVREFRSKQTEVMFKFDKMRKQVEEYNENLQNMP